VTKKTKCLLIDEHLFRQEMKDVLPLKMPLTTDSKAPRAAHRKRSRESAAASLGLHSQPASTSGPHIDEKDGSLHRKNGVQKSVVQKLKRGRFPVDAELDMHQMTLLTAHTALLEFIAYAQSETIKCVRVIHGKGLRSTDGPKLKLMTRQALRDHAQVMAFTACKPGNGGDGAVDVLLKST